MTAFALYTPSDSGISATVALHDCARRGRRAPRRRRDPAAAARRGGPGGVAQRHRLAGRRKLIVDRLDEVGPGRYRTTEPIPVDGNWKALLRLHSGRSLTALPIFLPRDEAIPVGEVPATSRFTRAFGDEHELLQREQTGGSLVVVALAYSTVAAVALSLLVLLAWGLHRLSFGAEPGRRRALSRPPATPRLRESRSS